MGGRWSERGDSLVKERTKIRHIILVEGLGVFRQDHITIIGAGCSCNPRTVAPDELFFLLFSVFSASDPCFCGGDGTVSWLSCLCCREHASLAGSPAEERLEVFLT